MKRILLILASLALLVVLASDGLAQRSVGVRARPTDGAEKRVALVIGNAKYGRSMGRLVNPANDAADMARTLRQLGFEVTHKRDLTQRGMEKALDDFSDKSRDAGVALFYFAGHGVQVKKENYLVPIASRISRQYHVRNRAVPASLVVEAMEAGGARARIVILDACRNNPLPKSGRSAAKGLASMAPGSGTLIAFAAGPGQEADENPRGRNGLYTQELLKNMRNPGLDIVQVFQRTRQEVFRRSRKKQTPQDWNSLVGKSIYLAGAAPYTRPSGRRTKPRPASPARQSIDADEITWKAIENSRDIQDFQDYLDAYPKGRFVVVARIKIRGLKKLRQRKGDEQRRLAEERSRLEAERRMAEERRRREGERQRLAEQRRRRLEEERRRAAIRRDTSSRAWRDPVTGMEFVKVPGGSFEMGCHANAGKCEEDEKPVRTVRLDGFWMGKHEVTQGQWKRIMGSNPSRFKKGDNYPVEQVSWLDVQIFIGLLNGQSSAKFRLPSEAQWEFACRSGGKSVTFGTGNGRVSSGNANYGKNNGGTTPVGRFQANSLGLKDMSGNVYEWVHDSYTRYGNVGTDNPVYERSGGLRVDRGGGWPIESRLLRCSNRGFNSPSIMGNSLGFRLLRSR